MCNTYIFFEIVTGGKDDLNCLPKPSETLVTWRKLEKKLVDVDLSSAVSYRKNLSHIIHLSGEHEIIVKINSETVEETLSKQFEDVCSTLMEVFQGSPCTQIKLLNYTFKRKAMSHPYIALNCMDHLALN
jgi:hypothetical protein